jgi:hypothetical protein
LPPLCRCPAHRELAASVVLISSDHQRCYSSSVNVILHSHLDHVFYVRFFFQRYLLALQDHEMIQVIQLRYPMSATVTY